MLYDLNIAWSPSTTPEQLVSILSLASTFGYTTIALNHTLTPPLPSNPTAPFPSLPPASSSTSKLPTILHRATFVLSDPATFNYRIPTLAAAFDLIAVRPLTDKAFQHACLSLDVPIISLDLTQHFPFHFRPKPCMAAVARGVRFEICYSQALNADARGRANFIGNATSLIRATRGRGFIVSSEAKAVLGLRAPADIVNLLNVWGLKNDKGLEGFRAMPRAVVVNEGIKRSGFRGVIDVVQIAEREEKPVDEDQNMSDAPIAKKNKNKQQNQKRKSGDEEPPPMSKRQAKKMKLAARGSTAEKK